MDFFTSLEYAGRETVGDFDDHNQLTPLVSSPHHFITFLRSFFVPLRTVEVAGRAVVLHDVPGGRVTHLDDFRSSSYIEMLILHQLEQSISLIVRWFRIKPAFDATSA